MLHGFPTQKEDELKRYFPAKTDIKHPSSAEVLDKTKIRPVVVRFTFDVPTSTEYCVELEDIGRGETTFKIDLVEASSNWRDTVDEGDEEEEQVV